MCHPHNCSNKKNTPPNPIQFVPGAAICGGGVVFYLLGFFTSPNLYKTHVRVCVYHSQNANTLGQLLRKEEHPLFTCSLAKIPPKLHLPRLSGSIWDPSQSHLLYKSARADVNQSSWPTSNPTSLCQAPPKMGLGRGMWGPEWAFLLAVCCVHQIGKKLSSFFLLIGKEKNLALLRTCHIFETTPPAWLFCFTDGCI